VLTPPVIGLLEELNAILQPDGAELRAHSTSETVIEFDLDLTRSTCLECVLSKDLLTEIIAARVAEVVPEVIEVRLHDPREDPGWTPPVEASDS
jgi:hypothetical protein